MAGQALLVTFVATDKSDPPSRAEPLPKPTRKPAAARTSNDTSCNGQTRERQERQERHESAQEQKRSLPNPLP